MPLKLRSCRLISVLCLIIALLYLTFQWNLPAEPKVTEIEPLISTTMNESIRHVYEPGK